MLEILSTFVVIFFIVKIIENDSQIFLYTIV